ncbi:hypothetical protein DPMN_115116 [Dreissena polymorpha]|uniref:Immunoglobulin I-set domain-containing protein n=1 Tax=Dreissena polymorpha TaxID=45954 RepID=A0A9D4KKP3_DREPO|nr:hypothetical protein DPMN_115116 [Dreissena polymorpha]
MFDSDQNPDQKTLSLRISNLRPADYGRYTCRASNFLGEDRKIMSLYGKKARIKVLFAGNLSFIIREGRIVLSV